mgnify:FL=1
MDKEFLQKFGKRIKDLRKIKGYTQDEFSFRANLSRSTLGNIETAQNDVTLSKVKQIADAFEISLSELFKF